MKIVVIGGTGLIGSALVSILRQRGGNVVAASSSSGLNVLTGEGLRDALSGAEVVVDVTNSPSFEDAAVLEFFQTARRNLLGAEAEAHVRHHIALSIVGADRLPDQELGLPAHNPAGNSVSGVWRADRRRGDDGGHSTGSRRADTAGLLGRRGIGAG